MFGWMKISRNREVAELRRTIDDMKLDRIAMRMALAAIADMETPGANATTKRMARAARSALELTK